MQKYALISVYNKRGIIEFAQSLVDLGWKIIASGGTSKILTKAGIKNMDVAELVGGGPILDHRVVTLSREVYAAILSENNEKDKKELKKLNIPRIDLVCVDLYPLESEINNPKSTKKSIIEKTDIGGPTLLRAAAKGKRITICDHNDRKKVVEWLQTGSPNKIKFISDLAAKAEAVVAQYCLSSANYHGDYNGIIGELSIACKYGENPQQRLAGFYTSKTTDTLSIENFKVITGDDLSYNNLCDIDRLLQTITHIAAALDVNKIKLPFIALGVKHGNACGASISDDKVDAIEKMIGGDTRAIFGGTVMVNFEMDEERSETLINYLSDGGRRILDCVVAPSFSDEAIKILSRKQGRCRLVVNSALSSLNKNSIDIKTRIRYVRGGFLAQPNYNYILDLNNIEINKIGKIDIGQKIDMLLAWAIGATSNSNTVSIVRDGYLLGNGVGQQDRVGCCELAIKRARDSGHGIVGSSAYSDSFFPFVDGPQTLIENGVRAILSYSGSIRDKEIIKYCKDQKVPFYLIPTEKGRGFFGH